MSFFSFEYSNQIKFNQAITLEMLTQGLDPKDDKKKIERIKSVFETFNTQKAANGGTEKLDANEQMQLLDFYQSADVKGDDNELSRREIKKAKKQEGYDVKYKAFKDFMEAYTRVMQDTAGTSTITTSDDGSAVLQDANGTVRSFKENEQGKYEYQSRTNIYENGLEVTNDTKGRRTAEGQTDRSIAFSYDGDSSSATTVTVTFKEDGSSVTFSQLKDDIYKDQESGKTFRIEQKDGKTEFVQVQADNYGRITNETVEDKGRFAYRYSDDPQSETPQKILVTNGDTQTYYVRQDDGSYQLKNGAPETKGKSYNYDPDSHTFTEVKPKEPEYKRQAEAQNYQQHALRKYSSNDWRNARVDFDSEQLKESAAAIKSSVNADELLDKMLQAKGVDKSKIDVASLKADLIHNNPSVFADNGDVWSDAKFNKLDFPKDLKNYQAQ